MKVGVISDTHINTLEQLLPEKVIEVFSTVDCIIHAGDILTESVIHELEKLAPVHAVRGNNDDPSVCKYDKRKIIKLNGSRIGIVHGFGKGRVFVHALTEFYEDSVDCIVFGHTHEPFNEVVEGIVMFNPGSATDKRLQKSCSIGILHVPENVGEKIVGEIIYF